MSAHSTSTPPGEVSAKHQPMPGMILFSEEFHDINAGLVVSIADPNAVSSDLSAPVEDLEQVLLTRRNVLLASSAPSQPPTSMLRQGTFTPFLGVQHDTPLDLCWVWALQGLLLTRLFLAYPAELVGGRPMASASTRLTATLRSPQSNATPYGLGQVHVCSGCSVPSA